MKQRRQIEPRAPRRGLRAAAGGRVSSLAFHRYGSADAFANIRSLRPPASCAPKKDNRPDALARLTTGRLKRSGLFVLAPAFLTATNRSIASLRGTLTKAPA